MRRSLGIYRERTPYPLQPAKANQRGLGTVAVRHDERPGLGISDRGRPRDAQAAHRRDHQVHGLVIPCGCGDAGDSPQMEPERGSYGLPARFQESEDAHRRTGSKCLRTGNGRVSPFGSADERQRSAVAANQARPGDQSPCGLGLREGAHVGSARAAGYSCTSVYERSIVSMPSSNCAAAMSMSV